MRSGMIGLAALALSAAAGAAASAAPAPAPVTRNEHYVTVQSIAPGMAGGEARIYVREVKAQTPGRSKGVVLFVHGAGTPAEVAFDVPYADYSWMAYLARAGFDTFAMDMEGYGRSTRPPPMADPCNINPAVRTKYVPAPCQASFNGPITTMASDWRDISAVVDWLLKEKGVSKVSIVAWSQGGVRSFGYTLANPDKVARIVALAPAYTRDMPTTQPDPLPVGDGPVTVQSQEDFRSNWDRQAPCPAQYEAPVFHSVWAELQASDPVGAQWGAGVRRAPAVPNWGFNAQTTARLRTPYLMIAGVHDGQVVPGRVRALYEDLGSPDKVLIDLGCSSHNAMWEKNHLLLFKASLDWLETGKVEGKSSGVVRMGY